MLQWDQRPEAERRANSGRAGREPDHKAELGENQTIPSGFRSGLLGAGKASLGEVHLWTFSETGGAQVGEGGEKQGEGSFKNREV